MPCTAAAGRLTADARRTFCFPGVHARACRRHGGLAARLQQQQHRGSAAGARLARPWRFLRRLAALAPCARGSLQAPRGRTVPTPARRAGYQAASRAAQPLRRRVRTLTHPPLLRSPAAGARLPERGDQQPAEGDDRVGHHAGLSRRRLRGRLRVGLLRPVRGTTLCRRCALRTAAPLARRRLPRRGTVCLHHPCRPTSARALTRWLACARAPF